MERPFQKFSFFILGICLVSLLACSGGSSKEEIDETDKNASSVLTLTQLEPTQATVDAEVLLHGSGFTEAEGLEVSFGTQSAEILETLSATKLVVAVPQLSLGTVMVQLKSKEQESEKKAFQVVTPKIGKNDETKGAGSKGGDDDVAGEDEEGSEEGEEEILPAYTWEQTELTSNPETVYVLRNQDVDPASLGEGGAIGPLRAGQLEGGDERSR